MSVASRLFVMMLLMESTREQGCGKTYRSSPGVLRYVSSRIPCQYFIQAPEHHYIIINITRLNGLDLRTRPCSGLEIVEIYPWGKEVHLARFCPANKSSLMLPKVFHSDTSLLKLSVHLSQEEELSLNYEFRDKCPAYCDEGSCLPSSSLLCNGAVDCPDQSDESSCQGQTKLGQGQAKSTQKQSHQRHNQFIIGQKQSEVRLSQSKLDTKFDRGRPKEGQGHLKLDQEASTEKIALAGSQGAADEDSSAVKGLRDGLVMIIGVLVLCASALTVLVLWIACAHRVRRRSTRCPLRSAESSDSVRASSDLSWRSRSAEVVYVPSVPIQCSRSCLHHKHHSSHHTPHHPHYSPATARHKPRTALGAESASLPVMSVDMPPHIPISRDGEEPYSLSQFQLSQHLLAQDYTAESVRPPPNRTVCDYPLHGRCSPPARTLNKCDHNRTRTYSDSRSHSRNSSDSSHTSSKSDDLVVNKSRKLGSSGGV